MSSQPTPQPGSFASAAAAWTNFWFTPCDPTLLGMIRVLVGAVTLYTFIVHSFTLPEFMGANAWCDIGFRREVAADRPIQVGSLRASPVVGGESGIEAPIDEKQQQWSFTYKNNYGVWPPAPNPTSQKQADFAMQFRGKYGFDFRFFGLPFPQNDREQKILDDYVAKYGQTFPPPYPANEEEIRRIDEYMGRHHSDPRRLYSRGAPIFSVWLDVVDPGWMSLIQSFFVLAAVCFVLGIGTRVSSVLVWFANICYIHRNQHVLFGVDTMMNVLLLYLMIGPSGAAISVDRLISRWWSGAKPRFFPNSPPADYSPVPQPLISANVALRLMQIHLCIIYFISGISKLQGAAWWNGTAVWGVLGNYEFAPMNLPIYNQALRVLGQNQAVFETFITSACLFTLIFEIAYPFLVWKPSTRWLFLVGAIFLHGFIGLFMGLKTFSLLMLIFNMAFLRPEQIRWLVSWKPAPTPKPEPLKQPRYLRQPAETAIK